MASKVLKWGNGLGVLLPAFAAKSLGLSAGSEVRILVLEDEIQIKPAVTREARCRVPQADTSHAEKVREMLTKW